MVLIDSETLYVRTKNKYNAIVSLFLSAFVYFFIIYRKKTFILDIFCNILSHILFQILCQDSKTRLSKVFICLIYDIKI